MTSAMRSVEAYEGIAPYYDRLLGHAGFAAIWRAFDHSRRRFALRWSRHGAADFGCGTGIFVESIAKVSQPGTPLFGVDRSRAMLAEARRRLASSKRVVLIQADIRKVRLPWPVDLITCNFSTLNYFATCADLNETIRNFAFNLRYEGHLVLDMLVANRGSSTVAFKQQIHLPRFRAEWLIAPRFDNRGSRTVMQNCTRQGVAKWRCWTETHVQRWWPVKAVVSRLEAHGLDCLAVTPVEASLRLGSMGRWMQVVARRRL